MGYCFHQLTGQIFSEEHLGSFLAGTKRLEKKIRVFLGADLANVQLRLDQQQHIMKVGEMMWLDVTGKIYPPVRNYEFCYWLPHTKASFHLRESEGGALLFSAL
jgi:hypothetical protein